MINKVCDGNIEQYTGSSEIPIGFVYAQLSGQSDPTTLFGGTWTEIQTGSKPLGETGGNTSVYCKSTSSTFGGDVTHAHTVTIVCSAYTCVTCNYTVYNNIPPNHIHSVIARATCTEIAPYYTVIKLWQKVA